MALVTNNIVKMDWDTKGWYELKIKGRTGTVLVFGSKEYESSTHSKVTVFFRPAGAFLFVTDAGEVGEDLWNAKELKQFVKDEGFDDMFPVSYDEYIPVTEYSDEDGELVFVDSVVTSFGLEAHKEDIAARVADIAPYGYVRETKPGQG